MTVALMLALLGGAAIGTLLGTLGAGGSILALPVLVHVFGQDPHTASTGALVVVGVTAVIGAASARRGTVLLGRGIAFGLIATGGTVLGSWVARDLSGEVLLGAFSLLLLTVAGSLVAHGRRGESPTAVAELLDQPIITFTPTFACSCPRALKVLVTATGIGLLTGLLGVGGGFLVVPALVLALGLPLHLAAGTSLVVIAVTSSTALAARAQLGLDLAWAPVLAITVAAAIAAVISVRLASRIPVARLRTVFVAVLIAVAALTGAQALI